MAVHVLHDLLEQPLKKRRMIIQYGQKRHSETTPHHVHETTTSTGLAKFLTSIANDDLLLEIFTRLPNARTACHCAAVCRRWRSVISHPEFVSMFKRQRSHCSLPFTLLFREGHGKFIVHPIILSRHGSAEFFSHESKTLHGPVRSARKAKYLDFLPPHSVERASCKDLLLVQLQPPLRLCICNPLTKQWVPLPEPPVITNPTTGEVFEVETQGYDFGFVCSFDSESRLKNYTVALIETYDSDSIEVAVFRSETGKWDESSLWFPLEEGTSWLPFTVGTSDGILYSPLVKKHDIYNKIAAFDPSDPTGAYHEIGLPRGFGGGWRASDRRARIGVIRGRLRIWQSYLDTRSAKFVLKVWQLNGKYDHWVSVVDVKLETVDHVFNKSSVVMTLHPEDDDVFFFFKDNGPQMWRYCIGSGRHEKIVQIHQDFYSTYMVYTLTHQRSPTQIPHHLIHM